jgi:hypothetical protein
MKEIIKLIKTDKILFRFYAGSFLIIILTVIYILISYRNLPPVIPIFNQLPWGDERLGNPFAIFFPDIIVLVIFLINILLSEISYTKSPLIARMFAVTSFLISFLTFLFIFRTIQIVL